MKKILILIIFCLSLFGCHLDNSGNNNHKPESELSLNNYAFYNSDELILELTSSFEMDGNETILVNVDNKEATICNKTIANKKIYLECKMPSVYCNGLDNSIKVILKDSNKEISVTFNLKPVNLVSDSNLDTYVKINGRSYDDSSGYGRAMNYSASGFEVSFYGTKLNIGLTIGAGVGIFNIYVDNEFKERIKFTTSFVDRTVVSNLEVGYHTVKFVKCNEYSQGRTYLKKLSTDGTIYELENDVNKLKFEVYGDSISCGYGILGDYLDSWDASKTYAYLLANEYNADINFITYSGWGAYMSPYSNPQTDGAVTKLFGITDLADNNAWDHSKYIPDVVLVNLGTNDGWAIGSNSSDLNKFKKTYKKFINDLNEKYNNPLIVCIVGMMTKTSNVNNTIKNIVSELNLSNVLFFRAGTMSGDAETGYNGHPNYVAHERVYNELSKFVKGLIY